jgi:adenylate cyclase
MLDPLSLPINMYLGLVYAFMGRYKDAIEQINKTLELDPEFRSAHYQLGVIYLLKGDVQKSIEIFEKVYSLRGQNLECLAYLGYAYAIEGNIAKVNNYLAELHEKAHPEKQIAVNFDFAVVYAGIGEEEKAMDYLEKAFSDRLGGMVFIKTSPLYKHLKENPRFKLLLNNMGMVV